MTTRIGYADAATAQALAEAVDGLGHDVAVVVERAEGPAESYVVHTPATPEQLAAVLPGGARVETY